MGFNGADTGGNPLCGIASGTAYTQTCDNAIPAQDTFMHGVYTHANGAVTWASGVTHTLPASFYLTSQPSWWPSSQPWPGIGPDITGGLANAAGHAYMNSAMNCYFNVMGGSDGGAGSPLAFNPGTCYGGNASAPTPPPAPVLNAPAVNSVSPKK